MVTFCLKSWWCSIYFLGRQWCCTHQWGTVYSLFSTGRLGVCLSSQIRAVFRRKMQTGKSVFRAATRYCIFSSTVHNQYLYACRLKTHICDKRVCGTETNNSSPIPDIISSRYIAECGLSGSNGHAHSLKIWTVASDLPWTPRHVRFPVAPALFPFSKTAHGKELGVIIEMLVSLPQTR